MKIISRGFDFPITSEDLAGIRVALEIWRISEEGRNSFDGAKLVDFFGAWEQFVDSDWGGWDISEYTHDIECRAWIQLAIEHSSRETASRLELKVSPIDGQFKDRMKPFRKEWQHSYLKTPFMNAPYFWETHTIHEDYWQQ